MTEIQNSTELLLAHGISPTYQRLQVLRYLRHHGKHPRAEEVYAFMMRRQLPLSRATVYNTLNLFVKQGLVREMHLGNGGLRYDINPKPHGHFLCNGCGSLRDVEPLLCPLPLGKSLEGCQVHQQHLVYRGLCPACS